MFIFAVLQFGQLSYMSPVSRVFNTEVTVSIGLKNELRVGTSKQPHKQTKYSLSDQYINHVDLINNCNFKFVLVRYLNCSLPNHSLCARYTGSSNRGYRTTQGPTSGVRHSVNVIWTINILFDKKNLPTELCLLGLFFTSLCLYITCPVLRLSKDFQAPQKIVSLTEVSISQ